MAERVTYLQVLRSPGALRVFVPALLGRLSLAMVSLALLLAIQNATDSFATAGLLTGTFGLANVAAAPWRARCVDKWGQRRILNLLALGNAGSLCLMACLLFLGVAAILPLAMVAAAAGGSTPPLGASMRVLWAALTPSGVVRTRAYSVDAVAEELTFTTGPVVIAAVMAVSSPLAGLVVSAVSVVFGTLGMTSGSVSGKQRGTPHRLPPPERPIRQRGFQPILLVLLGVGVVLGAIEVAVPAYADKQNSVTLAGWLLSAFAAGSAAGGLLYGRHVWRSPLRTRLLVMCILMALGTIVLGMVTSVTATAIILTIVGLFLAPSLITGYLAADSITSPAARTEASSWINTSVNLGAVISASATGILIDQGSSQFALILGGMTALVLSASLAFAIRQPKDSRLENK